MRTAALASLVLILAAPAARADCKEEILTALDRLTNGSPFRSEGVVTAGTGRIELSSEVVPPDGVRTRQTVGDRTSEMLKIGDRIWVKRPEGWREMPAAMAASVAQAMTNMKMRAPNLVADVDCSGVRSIDGKDSLVYTYKLDLPGGSASTTLYVDPVSHLPARMLVEQGGADKRTVDTRYTYDASLKLEPPQVDPAAK